MSVLGVSPRCVIAAGLCVALASSCAKKAPQPQAEDSPPVAAIPSNEPATPERPPRKLVPDSQQGKPVTGTQEYVAYLERPERAVWQKPDDVVRALGLKGDETVADIGAGYGYFSFRFAAALPQGKVVATDIEPEMIRYIRDRALAEGVRNIEPVLAAVDDPKAPAEADIVFVFDVLHRIDPADRKAWLLRLHAEMNTRARLIVVEFKEGDLPEGPSDAVKIPRAELIQLLKDAGFPLVAEDDTLLPYQRILEFRKGD